MSSPTSASASSVSSSLSSSSSPSSSSSFSSSLESGSSWQLFDSIALRRNTGGATDDDLFESITNPISAARAEGNSHTMAFGGCVIAMALHAAYHTLPEGKARETAAVYSMLGHFLGPTLTDRPLKLQVKRIRDTRSFCTRLIMASQVGSKAPLCFSATVDFLLQPRTKTVLTFSPPPPEVSQGRPDDIPDYYSVLRQRTSAGEVTREAEEEFKKRYYNNHRLFETRQCPGTMSYDNIDGVVPAKSSSSVQWALPPWQRSTVEWHRLHQPAELARDEERERQGVLTLSSPRAASACAIAYHLDMLVFIALFHNGMGLDDVGATTSLDFALRFHADDMDAHRNWLVRSYGANVAGHERGYTEANCWQQRPDGSTELVATMTQVGLFRGKTVSKL